MSDWELFLPLEPELNRKGLYHLRGLLFFNIGQITKRVQKRENFRVSQPKSESVRSLLKVKLEYLKFVLQYNCLLLIHALPVNLI